MLKILRFKVYICEINELTRIYDSVGSEIRLCGKSLNRCIYVLQILQLHLGFHCLILLLNSSKLCEFFISFGMNYHIFGPQKEMVSLPYRTVLILFGLDALSLR